MNSMNTQRRGFPFFPVVLFAAAVAIVVAAALTTWWVLLALIPLTMMLGCVAMMATHGRMPCSPSAGRGCCAVSALSPGSTRSSG
jgi:hypothetical protein